MLGVADMSDLAFGIGVQILSEESILHVYLACTVNFAREMCDCGARAFENDALDHALFPRHLRTLENENPIHEFRVERLKQRLLNPAWRYVLATHDSGHGHARVVGYAGWVVPRQVNEQEHGKDENSTGNHVKPEAGTEDAAIFPPGMDVEVFKHTMEIIERTRKELLGDNENNVWNLCSLAVDPEFQGRSIASNLVTWGLERADKDHVPAYLESTPAAVRVYTRLGFKELKKLHVLKDNKSHNLTVMLRTPDRIAET
ncbi:hypothetical protein P154DRAFT_263009 [Amniculicola lignicola CBS 123094]|uniref:N-acetyltransferase domain-containing protein n=1 Tax=Amniculicola lignicola CBS 123094 TaxID=1392246 RepID=A0A6A5WFZ8_9PLEO|nr:hypothetical protein P154DRAFT_263009 [Amniculicola lignicola CBS 123094]